MLPNWLYGKSLRKLQEILNSGGQTAAGVSYSNTESGLEATNAQTAIDEVVEGLNTKVGWNDYSEVGAVNLLNHNAYDVVQNGITFTVNPDRSITANGTATAEEWLKIAQDVVVSESARLSGCPKGGTPSTYFISISVDGVSYREYGDGVIIPSGTISSVYLVIKPNATVNNITFKPMISVASYNGPYVPYAKTNKELTEDASLVNVGFPSIVSGYSLSSNSYVLKKNGIVDLNFAVSQSIAGDGTEVKIFTLPAGSRPNGQMLVPIYRNAFELGIVIKGWVRIATNGDVSIFNNSGTAYEYLGTKVTFIAYQ